MRCHKFTMSSVAVAATLLAGSPGIPGLPPPQTIAASIRPSEAAQDDPPAPADAPADGRWWDAFRNLIDSLCLVINCHASNAAPDDIGASMAAQIASYTRSGLRPIPQADRAKVLDSIALLSGKLNLAAGAFDPALRERYLTMLDALAVDLARPH